MISRVFKRDMYKIGRIVITIGSNEINVNSKISISKKLLKRIIVVKYAVQTLLKIVIIMMLLK